MIRPEEKENEDSKEVVITTVPARLDFVLSTSASPLSLSATATITTTAGGGTSSSSSPPPSSTQLQPQASSYYNKGSTELAVDTPLTLNKLEKRRKLTVNSNCLVIVLVGLPARGKSFISRKLQNFLLWTGNQCKIFNVGKYRRAAHKAVMMANANSNNSNNNDTSQDETSEQRKEIGSCDANFFDPNNEQAGIVRQLAADSAMQDMLSWLDGSNTTTEESVSSDGDHDNCCAMNDLQQQHQNQPLGKNSKHSTSAKSFGSEHSLSTFDDLREATTGKIAIFDATNSTKERRRWILEQCTASTSSSSSHGGTTTKQRSKKSKIGVIFVESLCDDEELLMENFRYKIKTSPDFAGMNEQEAIDDLKARVEKYESSYETITDDSTSYIKIYNLSSKMLVNHIYGRMSKMIVPALMAWHIGTRPVFLCRPGQTEFLNNTTDNSTIDNNNLAATTTPLNDDNNNNNNNDNNNNNNTAIDFAALSFKQRRRQYPKNKKNNKRAYRLGPKGKTFCDALLKFCATEGNDFLERRANVMDTKLRQTENRGTSISGIENSHLPETPLSDKSIYWLWEAASNDTTDNNAAKDTIKNSTNDDAEILYKNNVELPIDNSYHNNCISIDKQHQLMKNNQDYTNKYYNKYNKETFPMKILVSTMPRAYETVAWGGMFQLNVEMVSSLNPIDKGDYSGYELYEMQERNPEWYSNLECDPFHTRFPGGESYCDLISRLGHVLIDIEQQVIPTLCVSHISNLQVLIAYFRNTPVQDCPLIEVPLHNVFKFEPVRGGGFKESQYSLITNTAEVDTTTNNNASSTIEGNVGKNGFKQQPQLQVKDCFRIDNDSRPSTRKTVSPIWGDHLLVS